MVGNSLTIISTVAVIDLLIAQANRLTETEAVSENCGVYMVYLQNFNSPIAKTWGVKLWAKAHQINEAVKRPKLAGGRRILDGVSKDSLCSDWLLSGCENSVNVKAWMY